MPVVKASHVRKLVFSEHCYSISWQQHLYIHLSEGTSVLQAWGLCELIVLTEGKLASYMQPQSPTMGGQHRLALCICHLYDDPLS